METLVTFTDLNADESSQARLERLDGHAAYLKVTKRVAIGNAVKLEVDDTLSLGEVSACRVDGDGYLVWVELVESLHHVNELSRLARALV